MGKNPVMTNKLRSSFLLKPKSILLYSTGLVLFLLVQRTLAADIYYDGLYQKQAVAVSVPGIANKLSSATDSLSHTFLFSDKLKAGGVNYYGSYKLNLDSAASQDMSAIPDRKVSFSAKVIEAGAAFDLGTGLMVDLGKKKLKTGVGYFKKPTDFLGMAANVAGSRSAAAQEKIAEGLLGVEVDYLSEFYTWLAYYSPRLTWGSAQDSFYKYLSSQQPDEQSLVQVSSRLDMVDVSLLAYHRSAPETTAYWALGLNGNTVIGESLELHLDVSMQERYSQLIYEAGSSQTRRINWPLEFLAGSTLSFDANTSLTGEYYYNGKGLAGSDYTSLLDNAAVLVNYYGLFSLGQHYLFQRFARAYPDNKLTVEFLNATNMQDWSGFFSSGIVWNCDNMNMNIYGRNYYGKPQSEVGVLPLLWQLGCEIEIFF